MNIIFALLASGTFAAELWRLPPPSEWGFDANGPTFDHQTYKGPGTIQVGQQQCIAPGPPGVKVFRLWDGFSRIYSLKEYETQFPNHDFDGLAFCVFPYPPPDGESFPVLRYHLGRGGGRIDHLITHNPKDIGTTEIGQSGAHGYTFIETLGYVYKKDNLNVHLRPIYRYWHLTQAHHAYAISADKFGKLDQGNKAGLWVLEGIIGYTTLNC